MSYCSWNSNFDSYPIFTIPQIWLPHTQTPHIHTPTGQNKPKIKGAFDPCSFFLCFTVGFSTIFNSSGTQMIQHFQRPKGAWSLHFVSSHQILRAIKNVKPCTYTFTSLWTHQQRLVKNIHYFLILIPTYPKLWTPVSLLVKYYTSYQNWESPSK